MKYRFVRAVKVAARVLTGIMVTGMSIWAVAALYYSPILPEKWRLVAAGGYAGITALGLLFFRSVGRKAIVAGIAFAVVLGLFLRIPASNDRDWQPEVVNSPYATINGDKITIHNVRNFAYRTETRFRRRAGRPAPTISASSIRSISSRCTGPAKRSLT